MEGFRQTPAKRSSKEENVGDLGTGGVALHQDLVLTGGADRIGDDGILLVVDERGQLAPEVGEASGIEIELEDAFLDASAIEFTAFGDAAQPAFVGDVVGDDAKHGWWFLVWLWHEEEFGDVSVSEELAEGVGVVLAGVAEGGVAFVAGASEAALHGRLVGDEEFSPGLAL